MLPATDRSIYSLDSVPSHNFAVTKKCPQNKSLFRKKIEKKLKRMIVLKLYKKSNLELTNFIFKVTTTGSVFNFFVHFLTILLLMVKKVKRFFKNIIVVNIFNH